MLYSAILVCGAPLLFLSQPPSNIGQVSEPISVGRSLFYAPLHLIQKGSLSFWLSSVTQRSRIKYGEDPRIYCFILLKVQFYQEKKIREQTFGANRKKEGNVFGQIPIEKRNQIVWANTNKGNQTFFGRVETPCNIVERAPLDLPLAGMCTKKQF